MAAVLAGCGSRSDKPGGSASAAGLVPVSAPGPDTEPAAEPASRPATEPATEPGAATEPATEPSTQAATRPVTPDLGVELFPDPQGRALAQAAEAPVIIVPRSAWTRRRPDLSNMELMNGVERITVHHTGWSRSYLSDSWRDTVEGIENIRNFHTSADGRGWADIAYHFVVDHVGRVWQGRPMVYQGAHARLHNAHNVGIVLMGNFNTNSPSAAQLTALGTFIGFLRKLYDVPVREIYTHGELGKTDCPGKQLQAYMDRARRMW